MIRCISIAQLCWFILLYPKWSVLQISDFAQLQHVQTTKTNAKRSMFHGIMNENEGMQTMHVGRKEVGQKKRANFAACHVVIQLSTVERFLLQLSSDDYPLF